MYHPTFLLVYIYKIECQLQSFGSSDSQTRTHASAMLQA